MQSARGVQPQDWAAYQMQAAPVQGHYSHPSHPSMPPQYNGPLPGRPPPHWGQAAPQYPQAPQYSPQPPQHQQAPRYPSYPSAPAAPAHAQRSQPSAAGPSVVAPPTWPQQGQRSRASAPVAASPAAARGGPGEPEEGDWPCPSCHNSNFRRREQCNRCGAARPEQYNVPKGKGKKGKGKGELPPNSNVYITGLPAEWDSAALDTYFQQFGTVMSCRVLPVKEGKATASGFVRMPEHEAKWVVENMDCTINVDYIPTGLSNPISLSIVEDKGKGKGDSSKGGKMEVEEVCETDNLYVKGLPGDITQERFKEIFAQYGTVTQCKLLAAFAISADKPILKQAGFVRYTSVAEARKIIQLLNGNIPQGLTRKVDVNFAGDGVPQFRKIAAKVEAGDEVKWGTLRSYDVGHQSGFAYVHEIFMQSGLEVYVHKTILDRCVAGPGDTLMFFLTWNREKPQASNPCMRIAADCSSGEPTYALRGWYKGLVKDKDFGFIECPELHAIFGKDVHVSKLQATNAEPGFVSFNCTLQRDIKDKKLAATCTGVANCDENWKPVASDLTKTREVRNDMTGTGEGEGCTGKPSMMQMFANAYGFGGNGNMGAMGCGMDAWGMGCGMDPWGMGCWDGVDPSSMDWDPSWDTMEWDPSWDTMDASWCMDPWSMNMMMMGGMGDIGWGMDWDTTGMGMAPGTGMAKGCGKGGKGVKGGKGKSGTGAKGGKVLDDKKRGLDRESTEEPAAKVQKLAANATDAPESTDL